MYRTDSYRNALVTLAGLAASMLLIVYGHWAWGLLLLAVIITLSLAEPGK